MTHLEKTLGFSSQFARSASQQAAEPQTLLLKGQFLKNSIVSCVSSDMTHQSPQIRWGAKMKYRLILEQPLLARQGL